MSTETKLNPPRKHLILRVIVLLLAIITSPLACCGGMFILDILPASFLPDALDFMVNLFEAEAQFVNRTGETIYLTPLTTTTVGPAVIPQYTFIRQRDIPLRPGRSIVFTYDAADMQLVGVVVCRKGEDCRLLPANRPDVYYLDAFQNLLPLEAGWLAAVRAYPRYSFAILLFPVLGLLPVVLFGVWLSLVWQDKKRAG